MRADNAGGKKHTSACVAPGTDPQVRVVELQGNTVADAVEGFDSFEWQSSHQHSLAAGISLLICDIISIQTRKRKGERRKKEEKKRKNGESAADYT